MCIRDSTCTGSFDECDSNEGYGKFDYKAELESSSYEINNTAAGK